MSRINIVLLLLVTSSLGAESVTLLHFSDYHSHAVPFYSEGRREQGGLARAVGYLKQEKSRGALVFSGGDTINRGSPLWSDEYRCLEWPWLNGVVDAMAYGNHDSDYGPRVFDVCRGEIRYPILSANVSDGGGQPLFQTWQVFERNGVRVGVFAVAGPGFDALVRPEIRPATGATFTDAVAAAREAVRQLREVEKVDVVVLIGHQHQRDDFAMARAVPGIDIIFGSHSHLKRAPTQIPETETWFISSYQYLTYVSRLVVTVRDHRVTAVKGSLERIDTTRPLDRRIAERVAVFQKRLENDPKHAALFRPIGLAERALDIDGQLTGDAALPNFVMDIVRKRTIADVAVSTASSFRQALPDGPISENDLRNAMPYDNKVVVVSMNGAALQWLFDRSAELRDSDDFLQISGARIRIRGAGVGESGSGGVMVESVAGAPLDPARIYRVATTDYLAKIAASYREVFSGMTLEETPVRVREAVTTYIREQSKISGKRDGRIGSYAGGPGS